MNLKSTPYLVLFVILGSIAVTAVYGGTIGHINLDGDTWVRETLMVDKDATIGGDLLVEGNGIFDGDIMIPFGTIKIIDGDLEVGGEIREGVNPVVKIISGADNPNDVEPGGNVGDVYHQNDGTIWVKSEFGWIPLNVSGDTPFLTGTGQPTEDPGTSTAVYIDLQRSRIFTWDDMQELWAGPIPVNLESLEVTGVVTIGENLEAGSISVSGVPLDDVIRSFSSNVHTGTDNPNVVEPPNAEIGDLYIETLGVTTFLSIKLESGFWRIIWNSVSTPVFSDSQPPSNPPPDTTNGNIHIDTSKGQIYFWNVLDDEWVLIDSFTIGTLDVTGDVTIGGHAVIDNDLHVGGDATVDGTLTVEGQTLADFLRDRSIEHHTGNEAPAPELGNEGDLFIRTGIGSESVWIKEPTGWRVLDLFGEARLFSSPGVPTIVLDPSVLDAVYIQTDTNQLYEWNVATQMWDLQAHLLPNDCADGQTSTFDTATDTWNCANLPGGTSFSFPESSCDATADNTCNVELSCGADRLFSWVSYLTDLDGNGIPPGGSVFGFCDGNLNGAGEEGISCQCQNFSVDDARCVFRATCGN